jgi:hypothetical protein
VRDNDISRTVKALKMLGMMGMVRNAGICLTIIDGAFVRYLCLYHQGIYLLSASFVPPRLGHTEDSFRDLVR